MDAERCRTCKYRHVFYMGTENEPKFSEPVCHWNWKNCEDVKDIECHYRKNNSTMRV